MEIQTASFIDFRILSSAKARGLINAMIGYKLIDPEVVYLVNQLWQKELLLENGVKRDKIVEVNRIADLRVISGGHVILPIQRARIDILILRLLRRISLAAFVHDLHFLSRRSLLRKEFRGRFDLLKKYVYSFSIKYVDEILVDSRLVQRQVRRIYNRTSKIVKLMRVFSIDSTRGSNSPAKVRDIDFFIPLSDCDYKGLWALSKLVLMDKSARILVNNIFLDRAEAFILKKNPCCTVIGVNLSSDTQLSEAYGRSKCTLVLSRHEGFGFSPFEAAAFGSSPIVLNCSSFIEVSKSCFYKIKILDEMLIESSHQYPIRAEAVELAKQHIEVNVKD
jgi:hypothetical protein